MYYYLFSWIVFCFVNFYFLIKNPSEFTLTSTPYLKFLLRPWKIVTFIVATLGIILIAPYTGNPTWDYIDAALMSILTFVTAPWSIGTLYRGIKFKVVNKSEILAVCLWMFSASWSYDLYLLLRDGYYPYTWFSNIFASSILYVCAGLFWNLDWRMNRGVTFSFLEKNWFSIDNLFNFNRIVWVGLLFMILVFVIIISFLF